MYYKVADNEPISYKHSMYKSISDVSMYGVQSNIMIKWPRIDTSEKKTHKKTYLQDNDKKLFE